MRPGLFAFAAAAGFTGAALYIGFVEQPARFALGTRAMIREWMLSNRRGTVMLSALALISAVLAAIEFGLHNDVRWIIGAVVMVASWLYAYFVMTPVNVWLYAVPPADSPSRTRELMRDWGLLEWGQVLIGLAAAGLFAWALSTPA